LFPRPAETTKILFVPQIVSIIIPFEYTIGTGLTDFTDFEHCTNRFSEDIYRQGSREYSQRFSVAEASKGSEMVQNSD